MITGTTILKLLRERREYMSDHFSVRKIGLFGSYTRDDASPGSDIDFLVELDNPTFDNYMELKFFLEDLLNADVDLVLADNIKPRLKPYITREVIYA